MKRRLALVFLCCAVQAQAANFAARDDVRQFIDEVAERNGMDKAGLIRLFRQTPRLPAVIKAVMPPRDPGIRSWQTYRARFVEPKRIAAGQRFMQAHAASLAAAEQRYGVPASMIVAIIGVETIYGRHTGNYGSFTALATLAFDYPPRAALFRRELEELLLLAREEGRSPLAYRGSYAGALGMPQFLPSSRRRYGIDFDGDGKVDLAASADDAIGSVANFLVAHGWEKDAPVALTVSVGGDGLQPLVDEGIVPRRSPREWIAAGLRLTSIAQGGMAKPRETDGGTDAIPDRPAALVDLVTPNAATEYRIAYGNFFVITRYNRSSFYAAAVMDLAAELERSE